MAERPSANIGASIEEWMEQRNADIRKLRRQAELVGRQALDQTAKTTLQLATMRPGDVAVRVIERYQPRPASMAPRRHAANVPAAIRRPRPAPSGRPASTPRPFIKEASEQVLAGARGAQDAFTLGVGDHAYAGLRALDDAAHGADLREAFDRRMDIERARDRYDAEHYRTARTVGQVVGTGAQIAALGPLEGVVAGGARIAQASPLIARELAALAGAGGLAGVGGQAITDVSNGRIGSVGDYVGAGMGGAVGALAATRGRAGHAGAAAGATTAMAQDFLNQREISVDDARSAALTGGLLGTVGGMVGRHWSDNLSMREKEVLGEDFSRLRTWARGDKTHTGPKTREYLDEGGYTVPDQRTYRGAVEKDIVESKFGRFSRLSPRQLQAYEQPLLNYRVDQSLPRDVGVIVGFPMAQAGYYAPPPPKKSARP